jgi:error-prone DNA polymerase
MVHPYLRRRAGEETPPYPNDAIRQVLEKTLGVPLFQEQVMRLAVVAAGFTPGEADQLRRAMGAWRRPGLIHELREKMLAGMLKNGLSREYAESVFEQIRGFGEYGFPESHAASFALLVYASAWLKLYHPAAFTTALLNSQPMGFYAPAQLVRDAQNHGISARPLDINRSQWDCTLEEAHAVRLGFRLVRGLSQEHHVAAIQKARASGPIVSIVEFARRTELSKPALARLAAADAFQPLGVDRRAALWQVLALKEELPLFKALPAEEPAPSLPEMPLEQQVADDYQSTGLSLKAHPLALVREELNQARVMPCAGLRDLKDGAFVRVAGLVLVRQRPETASGVVFMTLEDETAAANLVVWPMVFERYRRVARLAAALIAEGKLQRKDDLIHVVVKRFKDLASILPDARSQSRDFR